MNCEQDMNLSVAEIVSLLDSSDESEVEALRARAEQTCLETFGRDVHLRAIIEFSNCCRKDCLYCGLRRSNADLTRYRMSIDEIVETAVQAAGLGYKTIVLQSGEDPYYSAADIARLIEAIKSRADVAVTLSLGERDAASYRSWIEAGADRYLMRHETSNPRLHARLHPGHSLEQRLDHLRALRELGYQVGAGNLVSLPGQTSEDIADDLLLMKELDVDMAGIGPFIPNPSTPLGNAEGGTLDLVLREIALLRIMMPEVMIPATTALGTKGPDAREQAFRWGANVIMPNVTPTRYRSMYALYPGKICTDQDAVECTSCIKSRILASGRTIAMGYGHSPKYLRNKAQRVQAQEVIQ
jgi:biotin synthase